MENRLQHVLLKCLAPLCFGIGVGLGGSAQALQPDKPVSGSSASIDSEVFELGVSAGIINIENSSSDYFVGLNASFKATEDFFLQFNYIQADIGLSTAEENKRGGRGAGDDLSFVHSDLLLGLNLFQGELFSSGSNASLSALYVVGGVGDTKYAGESAFTYTLGIGYQIAFARSIIVRVDYRDYIYESSIYDEKTETTNNGAISVGIGYLF